MEKIGHGAVKNKGRRNPGVGREQKRTAVPTVESKSKSTREKSKHPNCQRLQARGTLNNRGKSTRKRGGEGGTGGKKEKSRKEGNEGFSKELKGLVDRGSLISRVQKNGRGAKQIEESSEEQGERKELEGTDRGAHGKTGQNCP